MDKESLLKFIKRILQNGSSQKASASLDELRRILEMQGADQKMISLVVAASAHMPETQEAAKQPIMSEEDLTEAIRMAQRRRMEAEMANRGRC